VTAESEIHPRPRGLKRTLPPYAPEASGAGPIVTRVLFYLGAALFCLVYGASFGLFGQFFPMLFVFPVAVLALLVIWALPSTTRAPVGALEILFFVFLVASFVWPNYLAISLPGLPWITVARLIGMPLTAVLLICVSTSKSFRMGLGDILSASPVIWKFIAVFVCIQAASVFVSQQPGYSLEKFINAQTSWTAIFFISAYVLARPGRGWKFAQIVWYCAIFTSLIGVAEAHYQKVLWAGHIPALLRIDAPSVILSLSGISRLYGGGYRVQSTLGGPMIFGEFIGLATPFVLHLFFSETRPLRRILLGATVPLLGVVVLETHARSGLIGFALSGLLYLFYWSVTLLRKKKTNLLGFVLVAMYPLGFVASIAAVFLIGRLRNKFLGSSGMEQASTQARFEQWSMGLPKIMSHPWGYGIGRSADVLGYVAPGGLLTIDTYYLSMLLDFGIVGFIVFFGIFISTIYSSVGAIMRSQSLDGETSLIAPATISLMNFVVIKSVFSEEVNHQLVFMIVGLIVAMLYRLHKERLKN
jgi:hypothetical protein